MATTLFQAFLPFPEIAFPTEETNAVIHRPWHAISIAPSFGEYPDQAMAGLRRGIQFFFS